VFIQELEEIGEKKMKEYKELLEEHQHILDEVKQLEEDLHNKPNEEPVIHTAERPEE